LLTFKLDNNIM